MTDSRSPQVIQALKASNRIAALNDAFRTTFIGGALMLTSGIQALDEEAQIGILHAVRTFKEFTPDNDPHD